MYVEVKRILSEFKQFKKTVAIVAVTGVIYAVAYSQLALMVKTLFDLLSNSKHEELKWMIPQALALALISALCRYFHIYLMNYTAECVIQSLRQKLQQKFIRLNLSFHNNYAQGSGGLISRILNDMRIIQDGLRMVADIFLHPLLFLFLLKNLFVIDWKLTLTTLIMLPLVGTILKSVAKSMRKYIPRERESMERMTSIIKESLDGVRVIQSFNLEDEMSSRLEREGQTYLSVRKTVYSRQEASGPSTEFIATFVILGVLFYTSYQVSTGQASPGMFIGFITSLMALNTPIKRLQESYVRINEVVLSAKRIYEIIDDPSEVPIRNHPVDFPQDWNVIRYKNVSFGYGKEMILKDVSLEIKRGEVIALVGASGSGKSTMVNLLERFFDSSQGEICFDNINILDMDLKSLRKNIALVNQDVFLFSDTIEKNIWAGDFQRDPSEIPRMAKLANAHGFIEKMPDSYRSRVGDRGNLLSGGEKQRISIARAMFKDAPVIILDEATSALDSSSEIEVQKGLDHLMEGRTAIVIAHRLSTIQRADKIIVMKAGQIVEVGTHNQLIDKKGEYFNYYQLQNNNH